MRIPSLLTCLWLALAWPIAAGAQPAPEAPEEQEEAAEAPEEQEEAAPAAPQEEPAAQAPAAEPAAPGPAEGEAPAVDEGQAPAQLEPPQLEPLDVPPPPEIPAPEEPEPEPEPELPDPAEAAELLDESEPQVEQQVEAPEPDGRWTLPRPVFSLHGYFRVRSSLLRKLALGRPYTEDRLPLLEADALPRTSVDPFEFFRPLDATVNRYDPDGDTVEGGCGRSRGEDGRCSRQIQLGTDMRLRLKPEIALGESVRVKMWLDVFDNVVFGSADRNPNDRIELRDTVKVRRAWGEVSDRDVGELRFGRMGADWGLGILDNGGDRNPMESDFSTEVDRIMGLTNLGGFYLMAAYDWASQGPTYPHALGPSPAGIPIDVAQKDDLNEITLAVARRGTPEQEEAAWARGEVVFNAGAYFVWRKQLIEFNEAFVVDPTAPDVLPFTRINANQFIPDLWLKLRWQGLRVELEGAFVAGTIDQGCPRLVGDPTDDDSEELPGVPEGSCKLRQFGTALESEYRLLDDRLGIYFYSGYASGDPQAYGLAQTNNLNLQRVSGAGATADDVIGSFGFHPDYRIDLILYRTVLRRIAGSYYFRPGVSFDFLRNPFGRRLGGQFNVVYSRASRRGQTWGGNSNLGVELDLSLYYRSEDGPDPLDGFFAQIDWGVLFPLKALQYEELVDDQVQYAGGDAAIMLRTVLGIAF